MKKQIKAVDARGRKLGGDTPLLCAPLVGRTRERLLAEATRVLQQKPDLVEWRVDFFDAIGDAGAGCAQQRRRAAERPPGRHGSKSLHAAKSIFEKRKLKYVKRHLVGCATDGCSRPRSHDVSHR